MQLSEVKVLTSHRTLMEDVGRPNHASEQPRRLTVGNRESAWLGVAERASSPSEQ